MKTKLWFVLALLVVLATIAPQPTQASRLAQTGFDKDKILEDGKITIAWIPKALNNPVFEIGRVGAETKAKELTEAGPYEVEINYTASVASDAAEQARVIEDAIAAGVEAIGVSCNDPTACVDPINKAIEAGIPVMTWDSDSPDSGRFTYLGVDNYEGGKAAADLMKKALPDGGKVALLTGVPGAFNLEERIRGFKDGVADTNIEVIATVACDDDINKGVQVVEETMQANPDLNGWFFVGLWPLFAERGSMPLWEEASQAGMKTVAFDTLPVELEYLKEGLLYGLVGQKYWGWGYDTTQMIYDAIVEGKTFESFTNSGMDIVGPNNVDVMANAWATNDFTKPLPPAFPIFDKDKILEDGKITIAWIPKALNNPVFEVGKVGAETKAAELTEAGPYEVEINYTASVASDAAEQARVIEDAIAAGVEAIGVSCNDPTACVDPIQKAQEAGIPVMTWDSDSPDSGRFTYLGVDNYQGGKAAARLMKKALPDGGKVALLTGVPGAFNLEERIRGFKDGVEGTNIEVVATVACNDDINQGVQVVEETMQANPDLNGWFFVGLWPLFAERGSMPLWEEASAAGNLKTVAFDTLPVELDYLKEGLLYGLVGQKYWGWGYDTTQMIYDHIVNGQQFDSFTNSGMDIVGPGNVDVMAEAWANNDFTKPLPLGFPTFDKDKILEDGKITIAWIPKALNNPVFEVGRVGAETKAAELTEAGPYEVEINYTASVASDAAEQARVIEDAVAAGVEAIGVSCNDPTACVDPINNAIDAGIPVMTWDSDSPDSDRFTYLGVDNYEGGKAAADLMKQALPDGGKVALLTGVPGAFNLEERIRGFKDGVAGTNIEIVATVACDDDINKGVQVVEETMQANPDLNGWFFVGLWPLFAERGSMPLWEEAATSGDLKTVAFDTLPVELDYLKEGLLYGLVGQKYWGWGYDTTQMIYDHIVDGKQFEPFTNSGMDIVGPNNVDVMADAWANNDFTKELPPAFK